MQVKEMNEWDPFVKTGGIIPPEAKMGAAVGALFLCFFSLVQSLRLVEQQGRAACKACHHGMMLRVEVQRIMVQYEE